MSIFSQGPSASSRLGFDAVVNVSRGRPFKRIDGARPRKHSGECMVKLQALQLSRAERSSVGEAPMYDELQADLFSLAIVETIAEPLLVLGGDLRVKLANPAFFNWFRVDPAEMIDRFIYDLGNGQWNIPALRELLSRVLSADNKIMGYRVEHDFRSIGKRIMLLNANRMRPKERDDTILLTIEDITERERLRFELEGEKEFADKLIDSIRESLIVLGWDLRVHSANQTFYETFSVTPDETIGRKLFDLGNGQWDIPSLRQALEDILPKQNSFDDFEVEHDFQTIGPRSMLLNGRRLDHTNLILLAIRDMTGIRRQELRQQALMGELQHRVKNILGKVRAMARQTRKHYRDFDEFFAAFDGRLDALARAQDLLLATPSNGINIRDIVRQELEAGGAEDGIHFTADGATVRLSPRDAQTMAMTVHELATNAAKYGALKADGGKIEIRWRTHRVNGTNRLTFTWRERGVRLQDLTPRKGFGSEVIEHSLAYMLGGAARLSFEPDGVAYWLEFPLPVTIEGKQDG